MLSITTTGGQLQQIDTLRNLSELEELTLRSATLTDINFIADLPKLRTLDISSTGILDLSPAITHLALSLVIATDNARLLPALKNQEGEQVTYKKPIEETSDLTIVVDQWIYEALLEPLDDKIWVKPSLAVKPRSF